MRESDCFMGLATSKSVLTRPNNRQSEAYRTYSKVFLEVLKNVVS
jgi:hypothetical protein